MILDASDQVMSTFSPTTVGTSFDDYIDRLIAMENAAGADIAAYINVAAAVTAAGGAATVQFQVIGNTTDPTFASGNVVLFDSGAIAKATLVAGYQIRGVLKRADIVSLQAKTGFLRYLTILVTIATNNLTTGTFNGWLLNGENVQDNLSNAAGYTV